MCHQCLSSIHISRPHPVNKQIIIARSSLSTPPSPALPPYCLTITFAPSPSASASPATKNKKTIIITIVVRLHELPHQVDLLKVFHIYMDGKAMVTTYRIPVHCTPLIASIYSFLYEINSNIHLGSVRMDRPMMIYKTCLAMPDLTIYGLDKVSALLCVPRVIIIYMHKLLQ